MRVPAGVWPKLFKALGVAGVAGVAATGVVVARDERRRRQVTPDQVRKQLRQRVADLDRDGVRARPDAGPHAASGSGSQRPTPVPIKRRRTRGRR